MNLHTNKEDFEDLCMLTSEYIGIPEDAVKRDYYIAMLLQNLQNSNFAGECVFKGGTSLSKCYPQSINRYWEDIDLTFIPNEKMSNNQYSKTLKKIEKIISGNAKSQKIEDERSDRSKSSYVWFEENSRVKLEIGISKKIKETDSFYLEKRNKSSMYNPLEKYNFNLWKRNLTDDVKRSYESLHENLVYGNEKQDFEEAIETFKFIGALFEDIDE